MELALLLLLIALNSENLVRSFVDFVMYADAGIPQGILLVPLIILSEALRVRMERKTGIKILTVIAQHLARVSVLGMLVALTAFEVKEFYLSIVFLILTGFVIISLKPKVIRI